MLIPRGTLDAFTSRATTHLGLPYDIAAYPGITLVDLNEAGVSFIRGGPGMASHLCFERAEHPYTGWFLTGPARLDERPTIIVIALRTNDRVIVEPALFVQTVCTFVSRVANVYHETLAHVCIVHPFPSFDAQQRSSTLENAFAQVARGASSRGPLHYRRTHVRLVRCAELEIRLHPTVEGHFVLGEALAKILRPLVSGQ